MITKLFSIIAGIFSESSKFDETLDNADICAKKPTSLDDIKSDMENRILEAEGLEDITFFYIKKSGSKGISNKNINNLVVGDVLDNSIYVDEILKIKEVRDFLYSIRRELIEKGLIGFNNKKKVWYAVKPKTQKLSDKEKRFLKAKGRDPVGTVRLSDEIELIKWIHKEFTPDEFERLCCILLEYGYARDVEVSPKRKSGADGGFDGEGMFTLPDGNEVPFIFEAKKHDPQSQIGEDICKKLFGTMAEKDVSHALIITTAKMSDRSIVYAQETVKGKFEMEMVFIDQGKMIEIMTYIEEEIMHGFGIYKSPDYGCFYVNKKMLKAFVKER